MLWRVACAVSVLYAVPCCVMCMLCFVSSKPSARLPSRLPAYLVPEKLRQQVLNNEDILAVSPALRKVDTPVEVFIY